MSDAERMSEGLVCAVAEALEPDDEVLVNGRSRPVTVLGFEEQPSPGVVSGSDYPYHMLWLRGNGTEYLLRWSHTGDYYPTLNTESELETYESYSVKHGEPRQATRATCEGETVRRLAVDGVGPDDLAEWAFQRSVDGLDESTIDATAEWSTGGDAE